MEINGLAETSIDDRLKTEEYRALHSGLGAETGFEARLVSFGVDANDRHVLAGQEPLDTAGRLKDFETGSHRRLVQLNPKRLGDLGVGHLDRVIRASSQKVVDLVDRFIGGIFIFDEHLLEVSVAIREEQDALGSLSISPRATRFLVVG